MGNVIPPGGGGGSYRGSDRSVSQRVSGAAVLGLAAVAGAAFGIYKIFLSPSEPSTSVQVQTPSPNAVQLGAPAPVPPVSRIRMLAALPSTADEYQAVFGTPPAEGQLTAVDTIRQHLAASSLFQWNASVAGTQSRQSRDMVSAIASAAEPVLVIVGHNEDGAFMYPDGSSATLRDLARACLESGKWCYFISCESQSHVGENDTSIGIWQKPTLENADCMSKEFASRVAALSVADKKALSNAARAAATACVPGWNSQKAYRFIAAGTIAVGAGLSVAYYFGRRSCPPRAPGDPNWRSANNADCERDGTQRRIQELSHDRSLRQDGHRVIEEHNGNTWCFCIVTQYSDPGFTPSDGSIAWNVHPWFAEGTQEDESP
jgi:hypothetical protein